MNEILNINNTKYYNNEIKLMRENNLNIIYINIQSLRNKIDDLSLLIEKIEKQQKQKVHIIALTEIWIYENENQYYNLNNYNAYFQNREENRSGGCCIFVHEEIISTFIKSINFEKSSFLMIKLNEYDINIACIYRCCSATVNNFTEKFENEILKNNKTITVGDMNINLKNIDNDTINYIDCIYSNGAMFLNSMQDDMYTRKSNTINTYIDHIVTNMMENKYNVSICDDPISDHRLIAISIDSNKKRKKHNNCDKIFKTIDYESIEKNSNFINSIKNASNFSELHALIRDTIQNNTKEIKHNVKNQRKVWATEELINLIKKRDKAYRQKLKYNHNANYVQIYEQHKKRVRQLKNHLKNKFYGDQIQENINNTKKIWQVLRMAIFNKENERESIKEIKIDGQASKNKKEMANCINNFFINRHETNIGMSIPNGINYNITHQFEMNDCTNEEIHNIIDNLNFKASNGYDNVSARFIRKYKDELTEPLVKFINESFATGIFPEELKMGCVIPIYKSGSKVECQNYRAITKLSVFDKIYEEAMLSRLKSHLDKNKIIHQNQFGFIDKSNTLAATLNCVENLYDKIDKKKYVAILSLDLSGAFDTVNLLFLIHKLREIGIDNVNLKLFENFLLNRKQYVYVDGEESEIKRVNIGVPQGSKLASSLFTIYINGILKIQINGEMQFYADDGTIMIVAESFNQLMEFVNSDLKSIIEWFNEHQLKINLKKTKILIMNNHTNIPSIDELDGIAYNNEKIKRDSTINYLGLKIDDKLNFNEHLNKIKSKILPINFAIYKIRNFIPKKYLWLIYHAHFMSHVNYLNPIWSGCASYKKNEIQRLQNKIIKTIENKPRLTPSCSLYVNIPNIQGNIIINTLVTIQKCKLGLLKNNLNFQINQNYTNVITRHILNLRTWFFKTERCKNSIKSRGLNWYNKIPIEIRNEQNILKFKKETIKYVIEHCNTF